MRVIGSLLRFFAFLFNLALCLSLFFLALLVMSSGKHNIQLSPVPLKGSTLTHTLLIASIYGFVSMVLALRRGRGGRFAMLAWNVLIAVLLLWTPFRGQFSFQGKEHLTIDLWVFAASALALAGSWLQFKARPGGPPR
ncbi:MAG: hypothetical protein HY238_01815 [Acidobacteria bacterium]|nr:hypothetical protein [Acidobacteriota bacterium]